VNTLDSLFPNKLDCYFALFQDAVYVHNNTIKYEFSEDGKFKYAPLLPNRNKYKKLNNIYNRKTTHNSSFIIN
jgi:hypothetical protein